MSVLTKISHNFYCHFNVPALCGGSQSRRGRPGVCGDFGGWRGGRVKADSVSREREKLELRWSVSHSLFRFPFIHANKQ